MKRLRAWIERLSVPDGVFPSWRCGAALALSAVLLALGPVSLIFVGCSAAVVTALTALVYADWRLLRHANRVTAERQREEVFSLGVSNAVHIFVTSRAGIELKVSVMDEPPTEFTADETAFSFALEPRARRELTYHLTPHDRGNYEFGILNLRCRTAIGVLVRQQRFEFPATVAVFPAVLELRKVDLLGRRDRLEMMGLRHLRLRGRSLEMESLREWVHGDSLRDVHWKATARHAKLITKQYDIERSQQMFLMIDAGRTMCSELDGLTKLDHAINATVLLAHVASRSDDRVGVLTFRDEVLGYLPPVRTKTQAARVSQFLYDLQPMAKESDYRTAFSHLLSHCQRRSLVILFTDILDEDSSASLLRHLPRVALRHRVLCVALSDYELRRVVEHRAQNLDHLYEKTAALTLIRDRRPALARLRAAGVTLLDATPADLAIDVVNRYLALKQEGW